MKTLGRILIILSAFVIVMGITYMAVSAASAAGSSTSTNPPAFERGGENLSPPAGERPEFSDEGPRGGGWMFGLVRNIGIVAIIVTLIAVPKSFKRRRVQPVQIN